MPKEMMWRYTCSLCGAEGFDASQFDSFALSAAEGTKVAELPKPLLIDACKPCLEAEPMATLLKVGYPVAKAKSAKSTPAIEEPPAPADGVELPCRVAGCGRVLLSPQGRAAHEAWHDPKQAKMRRAAMKGSHSK